ncbi:MAG: transposase [Myxococcales bacterium]|nr:transposase [Myxococcales bacterium]
MRDNLVDFTTTWSEKTEIPADRFIAWIGIQRGKYDNWKQRYGKANEHNGRIPRDHWLTPVEKQAILDYHEQHPLNGYRRLTFMMVDAGVVAASPTTVHRVLSAAGRLDRWNRKPSNKGTGFVQPLQPHEHWHIDISYLNVAGTFYYLCSILDGCSRFIVHWEIRESMKEADIERLIERARELHPGVSPRIISDNGPQFIANDCKQYMRLTGMTHVRTSSYYPQSNGKLERWHKTLKGDAIRPKAPGTCEEAHRVVAAFVNEYNNARLRSAIDHVTPADRIAGRHTAITAPAPPQARGCAGATGCVAPGFPSCVAERGVRVTTSARRRTAGGWGPSQPGAVSVGGHFPEGVHRRHRLGQDHVSLSAVRHPIRESLRHPTESPAHAGPVHRSCPDGSGHQRGEPASKARSVLHVTLRQLGVVEQQPAQRSGSF